MYLQPSQWFALLAFILVAPHVTQSFAIIGGCVAMLLAIVSHMKGR